MEQADPVDDAVAPWLRSLDTLEQWQHDAAAPGVDVPTLRKLLQALARGDCAVAAELPLPAAPSALDDWLQAGQRRQACDTLRQQRGMLLRLGVWRVLHALQTAAAAKPFDRLQALVGRADLPVPPGLGPALDYAAGSGAPAFFDRHLRAVLDTLAARHDGDGSDFARLARQPVYEPSAVGLHGWTQAWSAAVAASYLDHLAHAAEHDLGAAMRLVWQPASENYRAPAGLVALPSRERDIHLDLWADLVVAQALQHAPGRFGSGARWHRVTLMLHDLGGSERGSVADGGTQRRFRGLGIEMLYQAVFIGRAGVALGLAGGAEAMTPHAAPAQTIVVDVPVPPAGQRPNFEIVLRWSETTKVPPSNRRDEPLPAPVLGPEQLAVMQRWRAVEAARRPQVVAPAALDWQAAADGALHHDEGDRPWHVLGSAALWPAAAEGAAWLDLALLLLQDGRWRALPIRLLETDAGGAWRTRLLLSDTPPALAAPLRAALARPACCRWVARRAGLGVFVMAAVDLDRGRAADDRR